MMEIDPASDARLGLPAGDMGGDKWRPSTERVSAKANNAGRIGADGCPPSVLLQSSKSSACAAVPLINAASSGAARRSVPNTRHCPEDTPPVVTRATMRAQGSLAPARVQPTVSRMATLDQCDASPGSSP